MFCLLAEMNIGLLLHSLSLNTFGWWLDWVLIFSDINEHQAAPLQRVKQKVSVTAVISRASFMPKHRQRPLSSCLTELRHETPYTYSRLCDVQIHTEP